MGVDMVGICYGVVVLNLFIFLQCGFVYLCNVWVCMCGFCTVWICEAYVIM